VHQANEPLRRLYRLVENDVAEMDEILKDQIAALKAERDRCGRRRAISGGY
jgi:hypothetical protein